MSFQLLQKKQHLWVKTALACALTSFFIIFLSNTFHLDRVEQGLKLHHGRQSVDHDLPTNSSNVLDGFDELRKRAAPITWAAAQDKGHALLCLMENTQAEAAIIAAGLFPVTSPYTAFANLATWGWVNIPNYTPSFGTNLNSIFQGLPVTVANNVPIKIENDVTVPVNGIVYPASGGRSANVYNAIDGLIAGDENDSPKTMDPRQIGPNVGAPWTLLAQSSDLIFLEWQQQCALTGGAIGGLKYFFRVNVVNTDADAIIPQALATKGATIGDFAHGTTFYKGDPGFYALLAVPNTAGVAIMLLQHKAQMGILTISSITVFEFDDDGEDLPALFITIDPYTPPTKKRFFF